MGEKPGFMVYHDLHEPLSLLPTESVGKLLMAMFDFSMNGVEPDFSEITLRVLWPSIRGCLTRDGERYEETVYKRKYAAYVRWERDRGNEPKDFEEWMHMDANAYGCIAVHSGAMQTMPTTTPSPTSASTTTSTPAPIPDSVSESTSVSDTGNHPFGKDKGIGVQGENPQGKPLPEKTEEKTDPYETFIARHADDEENRELILLAAQRMREVQRMKMIAQAAASS